MTKVTKTDEECIEEIEGMVIYPLISIEKEVVLYIEKGNSAKFPLNTTLVGRAVVEGQFLFLGTTGKHFEILTMPAINTRLDNAGATPKVRAAIKNFLATTTTLPKLPTCPAYGLDQETLKQVYLPPDYIAKGVVGFGDLLVNHLGDAGITGKHLSDAVEVYQKMLEAARHGIGDENALILAAQGLSSLWRGYILRVADVFPIAWGRGDPGTGKTKVAGCLCNPFHLPETDVIESPDTVESAAVYAQLCAAGYFSLVIDEGGQVSEEFKKIAADLLITATGNNRRKRLKADGTKRESTPYYRSPVVLSNHNIALFSNPEHGDRVILLNFDAVPTNVSEWQAAAKAFWKSKPSLFAWLAASITRTRPAPLLLEEIIEAGIAKADQMSATHDRFHQKTYAIFSGLKFLEQVLGIPISEQLYDKIYKVCTARTLQGNTAGTIFDILARFHEQFKAWQGYDKLANDPFVNQNNNLKDMTMAQQQAAILLRQGICEVRKDEDGNHFYLVPSRLLLAIIAELRTTGIIITNLKDLRAAITATGTKVEEAKTSYDGVTKKKIWMLWIPVPGDAPNPDYDPEAETI